MLDLLSRVREPLNAVFGLFYAAIEILTLLGSPLFYQILVVIEIVLTALMVWLACSGQPAKFREGTSRAVLA